ncbi:MAG TPA: ATP synthase F1 subunit delta [Nitrospirae bacterium]|nr:ATP synthase subunit delta [bacterium BMS3Abin10]GBE39904.1 ATP synthase subunit delta [bacterium BMS3Bbin08]HDH50803.1 ATP synthase F1 subunit delta [Nitrospirota bacterium]HDK17509.1 ATP synthase F1 subunit delta [Nitrospirota bacterium]HDK41288.1 ATP synthase F1 subunit delta [Nitrospirota bacterium]
MNKNQIAKKYSRALINTCETADIPNVLEALHMFSRLMDADKKLRLLFASQLFTDDEKGKALGSVLSQLDITGQGEKFLRLIIMQGHMPAIKEIINASLNAYNEKLKKQTAVVISTIALEEGYIARLKNTLKAMTQKDIEIENEIDPSLLGGFIVKVGSTVYDSSLKGQFRLLKTELLKNTGMN